MMEICYRKRHEYRIQDDVNFEQWLYRLTAHKAQPLPLDIELPYTTGRALRSLLMNAPRYEPDCATATFEFIARHYSLMRLWTIYHATVKDDPASIKELTRHVNGNMLSYRGHRFPANALVALLYILISVEKAWVMSGECKTQLKMAISDIANLLLETIYRIRALESQKDPIRFIYVDYIQENIVCVLHRPTLSTFLREGGDWADLETRIRKNVDYYPRLTNCVIVD